MNGILPLWKEKGLTSHDCVSAVRRLFGTKKVGHGGTLDPEVSGVLPIAINDATRVLEYMLASDKTYCGEITLGYSTTTEDATGDVVAQVPLVKTISEQEVDDQMEEFVGELEQIPPMYSAVRVRGKRLYEYAREGLAVERPKRNVNIYSFKRTSPLSYEPENQTVTFQFEVSCSKGTYVRTLAVDLGEKLGYPAHMSALTRTAAGNITADQTFSLEEISKRIDHQGIEQAARETLLPLDVALDGFHRVSISQKDFEQVIHGKTFPRDYFESQEFPLLLVYQEQVIALYILHPEKPEIIKPWKVFRRKVDAYDR